MESNEEMSKTFKHVRFAEEEEKEQHEATFTPMRKPNMKAVLKQWMHRSRAGEYEQLKQELLSWNQRGITTRKIFAQEGSLLLGWAAGTARVYEPLQFICENVEKEVLQEILAQDSFDILKTLLVIETKAAERQSPSQKELEVRHKKFVLLLNIEPEGVQRFMQENDSENWLGKGVKTSFSQALDEYKRITASPRQNEM